jgi:hypothetical protein
MISKNKFVEIIGWYGAAAILGAYTLVSSSIIQSDSMSFQLLNLTGAAALIYLNYVKKVYQVVVLNAFWFAVAGIALINIFLR